MIRMLIRLPEVGKVECDVRLECLLCGASAEFVVPKPLDPSVDGWLRAHHCPAPTPTKIPPGRYGVFIRPVAADVG